MPKIVQAPILVPTIRGHHVDEVRAMLSSFGAPQTLHLSFDTIAGPLHWLSDISARRLLNHENRQYVKDLFGCYPVTDPAFKQYVNRTFMSVMYFAGLAPEALIAIVNTPDLALCSGCAIGRHCTDRDSRDLDMTFLNSQFSKDQLFRRNIPKRMTYALVPSWTLKTKEAVFTEHAVAKSAQLPPIQFLENFPARESRAPEPEFVL